MIKIKSFADACKIKKLKASSLPKVAGLPIRHRKAIINYYKLCIITEALNGDWIPDWNDINQPKYYPVFNMGAGFGFAHTTYDRWRTATGVGSRLCFKNSELASYAGKQFKSLYKDYLNLNK